MCGIAGIFNFSQKQIVAQEDIRNMLSMLTHRGPEVAGIYEDQEIALGHARLSIIDIEGGLQPISNEDGKIWTMCNGEIFNYIEIRAEMLNKGHKFKTQSDSEVLIHLYEEEGSQGITRLLGQFAFAIWDGNRKELILGRDRLGVRPLFYTFANGMLYFSSEIKSLLVMGGSRSIDYRTFAHIFTAWSPLQGETMFENIKEIPAGFVMKAELGNSHLHFKQYWSLDFPEAQHLDRRTTIETYCQQVRELLYDAVKIRLRADVEVGAYLSGGLDSTLITGIAQELSSRTLHTFSVTFSDPKFDESEFQYEAARALGTNHHVLECRPEMIRDSLPDVIWHTEVPLLRLAPVPMYHLSKLVNEHGLKVVLTGEGADEFFIGYDIFKETLVRQFVARNPESEIRALLFERIYRQMEELHRLPPYVRKKFFATTLQDISLPWFSHKTRWDNTYRISRFFSKSLLTELSGYKYSDDLKPLLPNNIDALESLAKAQYIEISTFLSTYLLTSQGDRVAMAHAVEGRHPFLDQRLIELANKIPVDAKIKGLRGEKFILKQIARQVIPSQILNRPKQPYRAPIQSVFFGVPLPDFAEELLSPEEIHKSGCFEAASVSALKNKVRTANFLGEIDQMAFVGILTFQLFHKLFITNLPLKKDLPNGYRFIRVND